MGLLALVERKRRRNSINYLFTSTLPFSSSVLARSSWLHSTAENSAIAIAVVVVVVVAVAVEVVVVVVGIVIVELVLWCKRDC